MNVLRKISFPFQEFIKEQPSIILLFLTFIFIFLVLLSYDHAWMLPEEFEFKSYILKNTSQFIPKDLLRPFDWNSFEHEARMTRPLASLFDIIDTKFRVWLWTFFPPHPSFSLTWIFSLILSPFLLYRLLINWQIGRSVALSSICFYLLSPGFLSTVVMMFKPSKAMSNFSIILCLYLASEVEKFLPDRNSGSCSPAQNKLLFQKYLQLIMVMIFSFFWDETALLPHSTMKCNTG